jgi:Mg2+/Co2+ transporter CorB
VEPCAAFLLLRGTARVETAVIAILIFAGASFFFALAETALFSLGKWQVAQLAERIRSRAKSSSRLLERPQDLLATLALGNTFANAAVLAVALRMVFDAHWALALTMIALAALTLHRLRSFSQNAGGAAAGTLGVARRLAAVDF